MPETPIDPNLVSVTGLPSDDDAPVTGGSPLFPVLGAAISGGLIATQSIVNADLGVLTGVWAATWVAYLGAALTMVIVIAAMGRARETIEILRDRGKWWWVAVGLCGIPLVMGMAFGTPLIGVAIASVCAVAGQTVTGLGFDTFGVGRDSPLRLTAQRGVAGLIAIAGLLIAVLGHTGEAHGANTLFVGILIFAAGALMCLQQAGSGYVTGIAGNPMLPALCTITGGAILTSIVLIPVTRTSATGLALPGIGQWYLYLGGPIGAAITVIAAWAVRRLGVFLLTLAVVGGQMTTSLLLDLIRLGHVPWTTLASAVVICAAVVLAMPRGNAGASDQ